MAMSNVQRIQCGSPEIRTRTRRVGAYCRVSTLLESQQLSLETQMEGFKQKIAKTPGWKLVDIYADEGITGTSTKKRKEFRRMIQDAQDGKIDTIITKSMGGYPQRGWNRRGSRDTARNTPWDGIPPPRGNAAR